MNWNEESHFGYMSFTHDMWRFALFKPVQWLDKDLNEALSLSLADTSDGIQEIDVHSCWLDCICVFIMMIFADFFAEFNINYLLILMHKQFVYSIKKSPAKKFCLSPGTLMIFAQKGKPARVIKVTVVGTRCSCQCCVILIMRSEFGKVITSLWFQLEEELVLSSPGFVTIQM